MSEIDITVNNPAEVTVSPSVNSPVNVTVSPAVGINPNAGVTPQLEQLIAQAQQMVDDLSYRVVYATTYFEFPNIGDTKSLYVDTTNNRIFRWNGEDLKYYCIGSDYTEIEVINGGTANE